MSDRLQDEPDYYAVLGVPLDATPGEIERAYRGLAGKRLNARWRPGRAARELAMINAAYGVLGYADRRADYDRRRAEAADGLDADDFDDAGEPVETDGVLQTYRRPTKRNLPSVQLGRPTGGSPADALIIVLVVMLALFIGTQLASQSLVDLSFIQDLGERLGVTRPRRQAGPATPASVAAATEAKPSPSPVAPTVVPPAAPPGALPTALAGQRFAGSEVLLSNPAPPRQSVLNVTLKLVREGQPVPNANVYLVAQYRTVEERQPPGTATVRTDANGSVTIAFNIGDATPNFPVKLDVTALVEGQQVVFQTSFTPR